jgi:hypothetical protein
MNLARRLVYLVAIAGFVAGGLAMSRGEQIEKESDGAGALTDGFETPQPSWEREYTDTNVRLLAHDRSNRAAHGGQLSEHFHFESGVGSQFFVSYPLPRVPVTPDLSLGLYVRSNRQGVHLYAKVMLPADIDPVTKAPSYVLLPGTVFSRMDRWENLELKEMLPAIEQQARVLRATTRRPVKLDGAYVDRVVVNLMGGAGETEVFLDDLTVAPVSREIAADRSRALDAAKAPAQAPKGRSVSKRGDPSLPPIRLSRSLLEKLRPDRRYVGWFPTAVDAPGADITKLRGAGNDVLVTDANPDPQTIRAAARDKCSTGWPLIRSRTRSSLGISATTLAGIGSRPCARKSSTTSARSSPPCGNWKTMRRTGPRPRSMAKTDSTRAPRPIWTSWGSSRPCGVRRTRSRMATST